MELVRVDRREVLLGAEAGHVDGVLAVGEDLLVLARSLVALAPRVRRALREPRGAALVVLPLVALGRRERRDELLVLGLSDLVRRLGVLLRDAVDARVEVVRRPVRTSTVSRRAATA